MARRGRDKPKADLTIGIRGHCGHGKSTLFAAIAVRQAHRSNNPGRIFDDVVFEYGIGDRCYAFVDQDRWSRPGCLLTDAASMDAMLLVVAANEGVTSETRFHLVAAREAAVPRMVVFLSKIDTAFDHEEVEQVEREIREALCTYDFPADEVPIIRGNSVTALRWPATEDRASWCIDQLMDALESYVPRAEGRSQFVSPNLTRDCKGFAGECYFLSEFEGSRRVHITLEETVAVQVGSRQVSGSFILADCWQALPGTKALIRVDLTEPLPLAPNALFVLSDVEPASWSDIRNTVGCGRIGQILK